MNPTRNVLRRALIALGLVTAFAVPGAAMATTCGTGLDTTDFTFRGDSSNACAGLLSGTPGALGDFNASLSSVADIGGGWSVVSNNVIVWNGFEFSLSHGIVIGPTVASTFTLTVTDLAPGTSPDYPISFDLLLAPKFGGQWAGFLFDDQLFTLDAAGTGTWAITFTSTATPAPVALDFLLRDFRSSECTENCITVQNVPEPGTLGIVALGLTGLALRRRRRI